MAIQLHSMDMVLRTAYRLRPAAYQVTNRRTKYTTRQMSLVCVVVTAMCEVGDASARKAVSWIRN